MKFLKKHPILSAVLVGAILLDVTIFWQLKQRAIALEHEKEFVSLMDELRARQAFDDRLSSYHFANVDNLVVENDEAGVSTDEPTITVKEMVAALAAYSGERMIDDYINLSIHLATEVYKTLDEPELAADEVYWLSMDIPVGYLKTRASAVGHRLETADNHFSCRVYYPQQVQMGQTGTIVVFVDVNGKTMVGVSGFTAAEDLSLIHGDEFPSDTGNNIVEFDSYRNVLRIRFFTGATEEFKHPSRSYNPFNANTTEGRYFAY